MNPLQIFIESLKRLSPSLVEYEVGSEVEMFVYKYLQKVKPEFDRVVLVSFMDAHLTFIDYVERVLRDTEFLENIDVVQILSKKTKDPGGSAPLVAGRLSKTLSDSTKKTLAVVLGLDFYAIVFSEKSLLDLFPRIVNLMRYNNNLKIVSVFNGAIFSPKVNQMMYTFSLNIIRLNVERVDTKLRRCATIIRSIFPEYNLKKWYYDIVGNEIVWYGE